MAPPEPNRRLDPTDVHLGLHLPAVSLDQPKLDRSRLPSGPNGAENDFLLAAAAQNLRKAAEIIPMQVQTVLA
jgi:hypothetical protein